MPRYIDVEGYRKLFDAEYKKTRELIYQGETHLDNIAEGFSEAGKVIDGMPTADVAPRSEIAKEIFEEIDEVIKEHSQGYCCDWYLYELIAELKKKYTKGENK